jgi:hypothetical protein
VIVRRAVAGLLVAGGLAAAACGKKGPPLPPLVLLPTPPGEFAAVRRDARVDLSFRIPKANTDRSTPADLSRVDVYAWTVPASVSAEEVVRRGTRVASLVVNDPPDPDEPEPETPAPRGKGLDQDAIGRFDETLPTDADVSAYRAYVAVGFNRRGRRGALSPSVAVPLVPSPPPPAQPDVKYDEKAVTVSWTPVTAGEPGAYAYSVYKPGADLSPLTANPVRDPVFVDNSIEWEQERCYEVRTVATVEGVRVESAASPAHCVTLHDTFAPARPGGLVGVGSEGAVSLIWTANREPDLAGYIVLRAVAPETALTAVTPSPIADSNFRDTVAAGSRVTYAVVAVDKLGNRSEPSNSITETAR